MQSKLSPVKLPYDMTLAQVAQAESIAKKAREIIALLGSTPKTLLSEDITLSATGNVVAAVSGKRIKVYAVKLVPDAALSVYWRSGASTALEGPQAYAANGGYTEVVEPPNFLFATVAGEALALVISGTGNVGGRVSYWADDAT